MVLNSAVGRFHSLDFNQCIGALGRFLSKELNQGSVDFKSLYLLTKEINNQKVRPHLRWMTPLYCRKLV